MSKVIDKIVKEFKSWTWHHLFVFVLTFMAYAAFHGCRKSFSNIKDELAENFTPNTTYFPYDTWQKETTFANKDDADVFLGKVPFILTVELYVNPRGTSLVLANWDLTSEFYESGNLMRAV